MKRIYIAFIIVAIIGVSAIPVLSVNNDKSDKTECATAGNIVKTNLADCDGSESLVTAASLEAGSGCSMAKVTEAVATVDGCDGSESIVTTASLESSADCSMAKVTQAVATADGCDGSESIVTTASLEAGSDCSVAGGIETVASLEAETECCPKSTEVTTVAENR